MSATLPYDSIHISPLHRIAISTTSSTASGVRLDLESFQQDNYIQEYTLRSQGCCAVHDTTITFHWTLPGNCVVLKQDDPQRLRSIIAAKPPAAVQACFASNSSCIFGQAQRPSSHSIAVCQEHMASLVYLQRQPWPRTKQVQSAFVCLPTTVAQKTVLIVAQVQQLTASAKAAPGAASV